MAGRISPLPLFPNRARDLHARVHQAAIGSPRLPRTNTLQDTVQALRGHPAVGALAFHPVATSDDASLRIVGAASDLILGVIGSNIDTVADREMTVDFLTVRVASRTVGIVDLVVGAGDLVVGAGDLAAEVAGLAVATGDLVAGIGDHAVGIVARGVTKAAGEVVLVVVVKDRSLVTA